MGHVSKGEDQAIAGKLHIGREQLQQFLLVALMIPNAEITRDAKDSAVGMTLKSHLHGSTIPQKSSSE